jgi:hypothetical protein
MQVERVRMIHELRNNQRQLESDTVSLADIIPNFVAKFQDLDLVFEAVEQVQEIETQLSALKHKQDLYSTHEVLFGFEGGPCRVLIKLIEDFLPLRTLWELAGNWVSKSQAFLDTPFPQVKPDHVNQFTLSSTRTCNRLKRDLVPYTVLLDKVLTPLQQVIDKFKQPMPLVSKLRHPGVKTKHWEQISELVGFTIIPSMDLSLQGFIDLHLERWNDPISSIASVAAQEYNIEMQLDQMDNELQSKQFVTQEFGASCQFILSEVEDVVAVVDDQLVATQALLTSQFIQPVKKRALERLTFLHQARQVLEAWMQCQRSWLYLQPIFSGTSIQQKLHRETRDWKTVDNLWASIMTLTHNHPDVVNVMHRDKLLPNLEEANALLETITQGLNTYLEAKRHGFPRFFFLSNDELITILSHTKEFDIIMKSMSKLFEYIDTLTVDEENMITSMNDDDLEKVELITPVSTNTEEIEYWLNAFEDEIRNTLKNNIREALATCTK